ncbi:hypothetical protein RvY_04996 [Ramazzottius varieornatus]|uniref:Zinc finger PHD-type domain-containing protein n=1 Tax=Ramazzottius varieornatus TaxID=947166 RepID=A0A1D1V2M7_RAMVA|nr:hypothetical protein RvY_04996 [Ramazzottius varieornatus]
MADTGDNVRAGDENLPDGPAGLAVHPSRYKNLTIHTSILPICNLDAHSSPSSKSNTPDHVVPTEKDLLSPQHRLSTSSGSSSPQTDGSITVTYRRYAGGPDVSRSSSLLRRSADSEKSPLSPPLCRTEKPQKRKYSIRKDKNGQKVKRRPRKAISAASPKKNIKLQQNEEHESDYIIRCICQYTDIVGEQIQCEKCEVWQHFGCMGILPTAVPDCYLCEVCDPVSPRPLRPEEAREHHTALRLADAHSEEEKKRRKVRRTVRRKPSDNGTSLLLRPTDLTSSADKKRSDNPSSSRTAGEGSVSRQASISHDELSRDDRKILQYEEMFKRLEERREKRSKRKRLGMEASSSVGSPAPTDAVSARGDDLESHEENTNPPPSRAEMVGKEVAAVEIPVVSTVDTTAAVAESSIMTTPPEPPLKKRRNFKSKDMANRRSSSVSETTNNNSTDGISQPLTSLSDKKDKLKPRYSVRLKNAASLKAAEIGSVGMRIELNCVKKRKKEKEADESGGQDDLESPSAFPVSPPIKKRNRSISFVDSYYSTMGDMLSETDSEKARRRKRAFTTSQELEKTKVAEERTRLYHLYGVKKAFCARYLQQSPTEAVVEVAGKEQAFLSTAPEERQLCWASFPMDGLRRSDKEARSTACSDHRNTTPISAAMSRSKTVRAMIQEGAYRNQVLDKTQEVTEERPAMPLSYSWQNQPSTSTVNLLETLLKILPPAQQVLAHTDQVSTSSVLTEKVPPGPLTDGVVSPRSSSNHDTTNEVMEKQNNSTAAVTPKKFSLAEYKQLRQNSQNALSSSDASSQSKPSISSPPSTPTKAEDNVSSLLSPSMTTPQSIPVVVSLSPPRFTRSDSTPTPTSRAPPRTSVIQRIGSVNNLNGQAQKTPPLHLPDTGLTSRESLESFAQEFRPPQLSHIGAKDIKT